MTNDDRSLAGWARIIERSGDQGGCPKTDTLSDADIRYSHMVDDYEKLVTADLRMLKQYRDLLIDAQHANKNGRTAVVDEFLGRTIDAMSARITAIKGRNA